MEWNDVKGDSKKVKLTFYYSNGGSENRLVEIKVNGNSKGNIDFTPTESWTTWKTITITASLNSGANTIRLIANTNNGGPNLDKLEVTNNNVSNNSDINNIVSRPAPIQEESVNDEAVSIYPNPTSGFVTIKSAHRFSVIDIYNSNGSNVYHRTIDKKQHKVDFSSFGPGIYYIQLHADDKIVTHKVIFIK